MTKSSTAFTDSKPPVNTRLPFVFFESVDGTAKVRAVYQPRNEPLGNQFIVEISHENDALGKPRWVVCTDWEQTGNGRFVCIVMLEALLRNFKRGRDPIAKG